MNIKKFTPYILSVIIVFLVAGFYIDRQSGHKNLYINSSSNLSPTEIATSSLPNTPQSAIPQSAEKVDLKNYGQALDFKGIDKWLNSNPLTINDLKGKVVLIDFWTYSCINCIRTLPYVTSWYDTYKDSGFVVIGVHTPEFAFEKDSNNVANAIRQFNIHYPVAQDNEYSTWSAYGNQYWPAEYLIDKNGNIVYEHFGEGNYDHAENLIRYLLGMNANPNAKTSVLGNIGSPEMYFGTYRLQNLTPDQSPLSSAATYIFPTKLALNNFALEGTWQFNQDNLILVKPNGKIRLHFSSGKVFIVAASPNKSITLKIIVDGQTQPDVVVNRAALYTLFNSNNYSDHVIEIEVPDAGLQAFTFTFG